MDKYTGQYEVGQVVTIKGFSGANVTHEVRITAVWNDEGENGVSLIPTAGYGFEVDMTETKFNERILAE